MTPFDEPEFAKILFNEHGDALFLVEPESGKIVDANPMALRLTGLSSERLIGKVAVDFFVVDEQSASELEHATESTTCFHGQTGFRLQTAEAPGWRPVTLTISRLHTNKNTVALYTIRDDTERQIAMDRAILAERELRQREARFRALVENSSDGVIILRKDLSILYASPAVGRIIDISSERLVGQDVLIFIHPEDRKQIKLHMQPAVLGGQNGNLLLTRISDGTGNWRIVELRFTDHSNNPSVGGFVVNFRDVTERSHAEAELRRQHVLLNTLFESVTDAIAVKDANLRFLTVNPAFCKLASHSLNDVIGRTCNEIFSADFAQQMTQANKQVAQTGKPMRLEINLGYKDGKPYLLDVLICPTRAPDGEFTGLVVVGRDVSEQRHLEDQLRQIQKMDAIGKLAGGIAHDFNNLLTVILGNLELARSESQFPRREELLKSTQRAARRAAELTTQLLGFARRQPMTFQAVDLNEMIRETAALLRRTIDPRISIDTQLSSSAIIWADPGQVNQILMNLCINARDAMPQGGHISISTRELDRHFPGTKLENHYIRLRVSDNGVGMSPEVKARIFEPFFTTKEIGQGTGLGLAVVFGIVAAHGGWIDFESEIEKGTHFDLYLQAYEGSYVSKSTPASMPSPFGHGERILVVDDEPMIRDLAHAVLDPLDYIVTLAADGAEAVNIVRREKGKFDLVVLDLTMPEISGMDALQHFRAINPHMRVLLATGYSDDQDWAMTQVTAVLHKPYTPGELARAVRNALDKPVKISAKS